MSKDYASTKGKDTFSVLIALCSVSPESYSELEGLFAQMDAIDEEGEPTEVSLDEIEDVNVKNLLTELFEKHWNHMIEKVDKHGALTFAKRRRQAGGRDEIEANLVKEFRSLIPENIRFINNEPIGKTEIYPGTENTSDAATATAQEQQKRVCGPTFPPNYVSQEQLKQRMDEYNAKYRPKSLMELNKEKLQQEKKRKQKRREEKEERHRKRKDRKEKKKRGRESDSSDQYSSDDGEDRKKKKKKHHRKGKKKEHNKKGEKHKHSDKDSTESEGEMRRNLQKKGYLSFDREQDMRVSSLDKKHLGNIFQNASKVNERFSSSGFHSSFM